jgi:hypothetical protein
MWKQNELKEAAASSRTQNYECNSIITGQTIIHREHGL